MPFRYTVHPEHRLCVIHLEGVVEGDDMVEVISSVFEDAHMRSDYHILWKASSISQLVLDEEAFTMLREAVARYPRSADARSAIVAYRDIVRVASTQLGVIARRSGKFQVFVSTRDALEWLGVGEIPDALRDDLSETK